MGTRPNVFVSRSTAKGQGPCTDQFYTSLTQFVASRLKGLLVESRGLGVLHSLLLISFTVLLPPTVTIVQQQSVYFSFCLVMLLLLHHPHFFTMCIWSYSTIFVSIIGTKWIVSFIIYAADYIVVHNIFSCSVIRYIIILFACLFRLSCQIVIYPHYCLTV